VVIHHSFNRKTWDLSWAILYRNAHLTSNFITVICLCVLSCVTNGFLLGWLAMHYFTSYSLVLHELTLITASNFPFRMGQNTGYECYPLVHRLFPSDNENLLQDQSLIEIFCLYLNLNENCVSMNMH